MIAGVRIGVFEVLGKLGEGGMGEVFRARDTRLNRDVAIKVLPELFTRDPDRLARFTREAQTLAALNHPNVAQVYGVVDLPSAGGSQGTGLVMELVEGEDLSAIIARRRLPLEDALAIARQIAEALEAAHEQGIVHRDLKPANIKVRPDGTVKVLDFGLAKALGPAGTSATGDGALTNSPTFTAHGTELGMILGTAAYMAPEQAKGKAVDRRADIWAFGVVLYEMITGRRAFDGESVSDVLASVLKSDPAWNAIPAEASASITRLLRRCLEKDPRKRLSSMADARLELDEHDVPLAAPPVAAVAPRRGLLPLLAAVAAGALVTAIIGGWIWRGQARDGAAGGVRRLSIVAPVGATLFPDSNGVVISPDGTMVAFIVGTTARSDANQLWVRSLNSLVPRRLEEADGAYLPFWSPDSRTIGFFTTNKLKTVSASGGRAQVVADIRGGRGAAWSASNVIVYTADVSGPLYRVAAIGGTPERLTTVDAARKQNGHRFPAFLPDGDHFVYAALPGKNGRFDIFLGSLSGGAPVFLAAMESAPVYSEPGFLLYSRQGVLTAQPFDARTLRLGGEPVTLEDEPATILDPAVAYTAGRTVSSSANGSLGYFSAPATNTIAEWFDLSGRRTGTLPLPPGHFERIVISPDGRRGIAVQAASPSESSLSLIDLATGTASRLSAGPGSNGSPVWSPDGTRVVFASDREGAADLFVKTIGDASPEEPFYGSSVLFKYPTSWTADGKWIVITQVDAGSGQNVYLLSTAASREFRPFVRGPRRDVGGDVSPDGKWITTFSDDTGKYQLYVDSFPTPGRRVQVSQNGALLAWWTPDGRQLLFSDETRGLWRASLTFSPAPSAGVPQLLAQLSGNVLGADFMPDRQRFLALAPERTGPGSITIVQNWRAALVRP